MTKYIECEAAIALASGGCHPANVAAEIAKLPAANVRPVRHGQWKKSYADHEAFGVRPFSRYCSECHEVTVFQYNYCPNCGADMREQEKETGE